MADKKNRSLTRTLSHVRADGSVQMVDVSAKAETLREAEAQAEVRLGRAALGALRDNPKGNVLEVARIAGIAAAKRTAELIPLCHNLAADRHRCGHRGARGGWCGFARKCGLPPELASRWRR